MTHSQDDRKNILANRLIWKDPDAGKDWGQEEKGMTEDEMVGWHHGLNGRESEWTPGVGDGQEAWRAAIHGLTKSQTPLSNWTETELKEPERLEQSEQNRIERGKIEWEMKIQAY